MEENEESKLQELIRKVTQLAERQQQIQKDILDVQRSIYDLKRSEVKEAKNQEEENREVEKISGHQEKSELTQNIATAFPKLAIEAPPFRPAFTKSTNKVKTPTEEFIGTNLLNKVGIAILVLGIGYGVKYSIDHQLISPITRIILRYVTGGILIGLALKLKKDYATFSAVLLSGAMAAIYFITYVAYDFYGFFPQIVAFALMVLLTVATVYAALQYNLQTVALIGLVGAYGVPFLLSDGSGNAVVLFSYMAIINAGILFLAFKKSWNALYYIAFGLTWLIFSVWWFKDFTFKDYLVTSLIFSTLFFIIFYSIFLAYKLLRKEPFDRWDVVMVLLNSFFYFWFGYYSIMDYGTGGNYVGLFTLFHGLLHLVACLLVYSKREQHKDVFFFEAGLVLVFITLAVPIQLDGHWVTLLWAGEAAVLFFVGRTKNFPTYERLAYPLILLTFISLLGDWEDYYRFGDQAIGHPILINIQFFSSLIVCGAFVFILWLSQQEKYPQPFNEKSSFQTFFNVSLTGIVFLTAYFTFYKEVESFWEQRYLLKLDEDTQNFKSLWLTNYSAIFGLLMAIITFRLNNRTFSFFQVCYNVIVLIAFLVIGLTALTELRTSYLADTTQGMWSHVGIRYVCMLFVLPLIWVNRRLLRKEYFNNDLRQVEMVLFHLFIIALLSNELINALDLNHIDNSDKLAMSILWGSYALGLIVWGLWKKIRTIRILAMAIFGITLVKLFLYDISGMSTIAKTIVMMTLGALLLVASFLYNRVKKAADDDGKKTPN